MSDRQHIPATTKAAHTFQNGTGNFCALAPFPNVIPDCPTGLCPWCVIKVCVWSAPLLPKKLPHPRIPQGIFFGGRDNIRPSVLWEVISSVSSRSDRTVPSIDVTTRVGVVKASKDVCFLFFSGHAYVSKCAGRSCASYASPHTKHSPEAMKFHMLRFFGGEVENYRCLSPSKYCSEWKDCREC